MNEERSFMKLNSGRMYVWSLSERDARKFFRVPSGVEVQVHEEFEPDTTQIYACSNLYSVSIVDLEAHLSPEEGL
jgi:hypothetical protein